MDFVLFERNQQMLSHKLYLYKTNKFSLHKINPIFFFFFFVVVTDVSFFNTVIVFSGKLKKDVNKEMPFGASFTPFLAADDSENSTHEESVGVLDNKGDKSSLLLASPQLLPGRYPITSPPSCQSGPSTMALR